MNSKSVKEGGKHNMYSKSKRFIASFLAVLMAVCMLPVDMLGGVGVVNAAEGDLTAKIGEANVKASNDVAKDDTTVKVTLATENATATDIMWSFADNVDFTDVGTYTSATDKKVLGEGDKSVDVPIDTSGNVGTSVTLKAAVVKYDAGTPAEGTEGEEGYVEAVPASVTIIASDSYTFNIKTAVITDANVALSSTSMVAGGTVPTVTVTVKGEEVTQSGNYTVKYFVGNEEKNVDALQGIEVGEEDDPVTVTVKVTGTGNYGGEVEKEFTIIADENGGDDKVTVGTVTPSTAAGAVTSGTEITLSYTAVANEEADIYYTTDATKATSAEALAVEANKYTANTKITISTATTIYAVAKVGTTLGNLQTFAYTISGGTQPPAPIARLNRRLNMTNVTKADIAEGSEEKKNGFTLIGKLPYGTKSISGATAGTAGETPSGRYQLGKLSSGESVNDARVKEGVVNGAIKFEAQAGATVSIWGMAGSSGSGALAKLLVCKLENKSLVTVATCTTGADKSADLTTTYALAETKINEEGTFYIVNDSETSSYNLFYIEVTYTDVEEFTDDATVKVTFEANGGSTVADKDVVTGQKCPEPGCIRDGFVLEGWYKDSNLSQKFNFATDTVSGAMTLYAKWVAEDPKTRTELTLNIPDLPEASYADGFTKNGFTVGKRVSIVAANDKLGTGDDAVTYTKLLKFGGASNAAAGDRDFVFNITEPSVLTVVAAAGGASRSLKVKSETDENVAEQEIMGATTTVSKNKVSLATAGQYRIYGTGDYKIYYVSVEADTRTALTAPAIAPTDTTTPLEREAEITITHTNNTGTLKYAVGTGDYSDYTTALVAGELVGNEGGSVTINAKVVAAAGDTTHKDSTVTTVTYTVKAEPGPGPGPVDPDDPANDPDNAEVVNANGLWIAGINAAGYDYANGAKITPAVLVYHGDKRLTEKVDYTISYKNNVNVPAEGAAENKLPTIVVKGKGNYAGTATKTFVIKPAKISASNCDAEMAVVAKKNDKEQKPLPTVSVLVNGKVKKLKNNKDYEVKYYEAEDQENPAPKEDATLSDSVTKAAIYYARVTGKTNYTGTVDIPLTVLATDSTTVLASKLKVTVAKVTYSKEEATKTGFEGFEPEVTVKAGRDTLAKDTDYTLSWSNNTLPGTASVTVTPVTPQEGVAKFVGTKTVNFKIAGVAIKSCKVDVSAADLTYTGDEEAFCTEIGNKLVVKKGATTLDKAGTDGVDDPDYTYDVKIDENNKTKVIVTITGKCAYEGTVAKTFKVKPLAITDDTKVSVVVNYPETKDGDGDTPAQSVPLMKGGAKPSVTVTVGESTLEEGVDYTLSYTKNKAVGQATVKVKGKGVLKGTKPVNFNIGAKELDGNVSLVVSNVAVAKNAAKPANYDCKPVLVDADGVKLAKKDYTIKYYDITEKTDAPTPPETSSALEEGGEGEGGNESSGPEPIAKITKYTASVGTVIKVVAEGVAEKGYTGTIEATYEVRANNFAKAKIKIEPQNYDGTAVVFEADSDGKIADITVTCGDATLNPQDSADSTEDGYYIASYDKNDKKGTAKVTLVGTGSYAGSKTASFKIGAKTMAWWAPSTSAGDALEYIKDAVIGLFN